MKTHALTLAAICTILLAFATIGDSAPRKMNPSDSKKATVAEKMPAAQSNAREMVSDLTTTQKSKMLTLLNEGTAKDLAGIKGVAKTRGEAIEKARPFDSIDEVILVKGIGKGTFVEIISHARSLTARRSSSSKKS